MESTYFFKSNFLLPPSFWIIAIITHSPQTGSLKAEKLQPLEITYSQIGIFTLRSPQMMIQQQKRIHLESVLG